MTGTLLLLAVTGAQVLLACAAALAGWRVLAGPRAQDRVLGLDTLYVTGMLFFVVTGMRTGTPFFFEAAMVIALLGFVAKVALARLLIRGWVVE